MLKIGPAVTAAAVLAIASPVCAQDAVQWRVEDGGNGHWYQGRRLSASSHISWSAARSNALGAGADLVSLNDEAEVQWVYFNISSQPNLWSLSSGPWIGAFQPSGSSEPNGGWIWVDGSALSVVFPWTFSQPDNATYCGGAENFAFYWFGEGLPQPANRFADLVESGYCVVRAQGDWVTSAVLEWSADCNADGIVDYGQCLNGTLPDYNGNNIPDCCERGEPCVPGHYPVQWRISDGGNGHWYQGERSPGFVSWSQAKAIALASGGSLASIGDAEESQWVYARIASDAGLWANYGPYRVGPWIGGRGGSGNWRWDDGTAWTYSAWYPGEGPPSPDPVEQFAHFFNGTGAVFPANQWGDYFDVLVTPSYIIEWSADCNSDGIVDYGQILTGQLADTNSDGIPDVCQQPTCNDADLYPNGRIDGADLGILLSEWGAVTSTTNSDFNHDGRVDGADLGFLLANWGPCP